MNIGRVPPVKFLEFALVHRSSGIDMRLAGKSYTPMSIFPKFDEGEISSGFATAGRDLKGPLSPAFASRKHRLEELSGNGKRASPPSWRKETRRSSVDVQPRS